VNAGRLNPKNGTWKTKAQFAAESEPSRIPDFSDGEDDENDENAGVIARLQQEFDDGLDDSWAGPEESTEPLERNHHGNEDASMIDTTPPRTDETSTSKANKGAAKTVQQDELPAKTRGRPPKSQRGDIDGDADTRPTKKRITAKVAQAAREPLDPELDRVVDNYANRTGPLKGRSLYILKRENPEDTSATHTRSGRVSVRPLAYWRNERCVFGDGEVEEGHRYPLSTIKEVIRTEEQEPEKKKSKRGRKPKSKKSGNDSTDEEDEEADLWEQEGGVLHGYVQMWDSKTQTPSKEEEVLGKNAKPAVVIHMLTCDRRCICSFWHRNSRGQRLIVPVRKTS
jgi:centromere protein C